MHLPGLRYEGPIYRPPSESSSLLVQATVGCPHNKCTFCMVYKNEPKFRIRPVTEIKEDLLWAQQHMGSQIKTVFFPAGNTIIMKTKDLVEIFSYTKDLFPDVQRITVYGSSQYIIRKTPEELKQIHEAGLTRIHVGLESGDDTVLSMVKKGATAEEHINAGKMIKAAGIELSEYVVLGIGGKQYSAQHIQATIVALNAIDPDFIRIRTFLPKIKTPILDDIKSGKFQILTPHEVLQETLDLIEGLEVTSHVVSDHYTNYIHIEGILPDDKGLMVADIKHALTCNESSFRDVYIGTQ